MHYRILLGEEEDGMFIAVCMVFPDCILQGKTRYEALKFRMQLKAISKAWWKSTMNLFLLQFRKK